MADFQAIADSITFGKAAEAKTLVEQALGEGLTAQEVLHQGVIKGIDAVREKLKANEFYIPEVLIASRAMEEAMKLLVPRLKEEGAEPMGICVLGTAKGDLHDIGKNLVGKMMLGAGFEVVDIGIDCSAEKFVETAKEHNASLLGISALLTTTMPYMETVIQAVKEAGVDVKVMIGGAPVTQEYADKIGADGYAPDAASAVDKAKELLGAAG